LLFLSVKILTKANNQVENLYDQEYEYSSVYNDFISNIRTVKLLNDDDYFVNKISREGKKCYNENKKYVKYYSFEEALRHFDSDVADFYFYTLPDRQGYHFFTNAFGSEAAIMIDNEIFAYKHRRLYNKRHLTNRYFGEKDFRSGEYFNRIKQR